MTRTWITAAPSALSLVVPMLAHAQEQLLAQYVADIRAEDRHNSTGVRLTSFAALLAQDRANYHRFGIRHSNDGADPIFGDRAMRAQITDAVVEVSPGYAGYVQSILGGDIASTYLVVYVHGTGTQITRISFVVPG
ncbi:hypothetical protein [Jannaschia sp. CCS1]|uniref:hypothetical protein n=1 Tax=Jannaschia sp. (strain CCS1) TaxID=290400 RepID=UPI000053A5B3|nr:hypothetical protein [Jannaschia sp. CCS1]ABD55213.1 hypothetical protein Jann_2296 [Jannaschia sp. CCS1]